MLEERDARIAVLEAENVGLREALQALVDALESDGLHASDAYVGDCKICVARRLAAETLAGAQPPAAAAYPTHSEGGEAASPSPSALTEATRTPKDFALEFAEYLAKAAERYMAFTPDNPDEEGDAYRALRSAIYEFRKRVVKVPLASALSPKGGTP